MIAFRDVLIFAGLMALAAAVIASLFPAGEGVSPVPACSDCAFKLTGGYWMRQYDNYAALYLGTREAARYGWAYVDGRPLSIGENATCNPMYVHVLNGIAYVSCSGGTDVGVNTSPAFRRWVQPVARGSGVTISVNPLEPGCTYTVDVYVNTSIVKLEVYSYGILLYSALDIPPTSFTYTEFKRSLLSFGYHMYIHAPPLPYEVYALYAKMKINATKNVVIFSNNPYSYLITQNRIYSFYFSYFNDPYYRSLKIIDLTDLWSSGFDSMTVDINGSWSFCRSITIPAPATDFFADYLLAWEEHAVFDYCTYRDEIWRLTFTPSGPVLTRLHSEGGFWHEVYADGQLIWTFRKDGPKNDIYIGFDPTITVRFVSPDSRATAEATFTKVCKWYRIR